MVIENKDKKKDRTTSRVVHNTAQDTIPYLEQYENGLYLIDREKGLGRYAFIWHLGNTDYRLLKDTEKQKRLDAYSAVFNTLPPDIHYEETSTYRSTKLPSEKRSCRQRTQKNKLNLNGHGAKTRPVLQINLPNG